MKWRDLPGSAKAEALDVLATRKRTIVKKLGETMVPGDRAELYARLASIDAAIEELERTS